MAKTSGGGSVKKIVVPSEWFVETRKKLEQAAVSHKESTTLNAEQETLIREFYGKVSKKQIGVILGMSYNSIRYWTAKMGLLQGRE